MGIKKTRDRKRKSIQKRRSRKQQKKRGTLRKKNRSRKRAGGVWPWDNNAGDARPVVHTLKEQEQLAKLHGKQMAAPGKKARRDAAAAAQRKKEAEAAAAWEKANAEKKQRAAAMEKAKDLSNYYTGVFW